MNWAKFTFVCRRLILRWRVSSLSKTLTAAPKIELFTWGEQLKSSFIRWFSSLIALIIPLKQNKTKKSKQTMLITIEYNARQCPLQWLCWNLFDWRAYIRTVWANEESRLAAGRGLRWWRPSFLSCDRSWVVRVERQWEAGGSCIGYCRSTRRQHHLTLRPLPAPHTREAV